jgi:CBS domain containing-hemolysin-like protein
MSLIVALCLFCVVLLLVLIFIGATEVRRAQIKNLSDDDMDGQGNKIRWHGNNDNFYNG